MNYIDIQVSQRHATYTPSSPAPVCGNKDYTIRFTFDDEWAAYENKTARFVTSDGHTDVLFSGTECVAPPFSNVRWVEVGVYAGDLKTTTPAYVPLDRSILCGDSTVHPEPPEDVYNQLLERLNAINPESGAGDCQIEYVESLDEDNMVVLRDLESNLYLLYGYFKPFPGSDSTLVIDRGFYMVTRVDEGSHLLSISPLNFKMTCHEILVDDTNEKGYTYTSTRINLLDVKDAAEKANDAVSYAEAQELTDEQKALVRQNIDAQISDFVITMKSDEDGNLIPDKTWAEATEAYKAGRRLSCVYNSREYALDSFWEGEEAHFVHNSITDLTEQRIYFLLDGTAYWSTNKASTSTFPVASVNGQTGAVKLTASDVGAVPAPGTATVGQVVKVSAVDATGKPTAWEAVDFPSVPGTLPNPAALTFTGAVSATYDGSSSVSVTIPTGGGTELTDLVDETLTEAVVSISYDFGEAYKYLDIYTYTPRAADNTTNNNTINLRPNGNSAYPIGVGGISTYGPLTYHTVLRCYDEGIVYEGEFDKTRTQGGTKVATLFANGIQTMVLIPNTNGETDMIPVGTHIIIRGREKL